MVNASRGRVVVADTGRHRVAASS
ncbi:hypothetical protein ACN6LA_007501 [Streptomyces sp. SAS_269]